MIGIRPSPLFHRVIIVIALPLLVLSENKIPEPVGGFLVLLRNIRIARGARHSKTLIGVQEKIDHIGEILQSAVRASADNDAGALILRNLFDRIKLGKKNLLADRHIGKARIVEAEGICIHDQIIQKGTCGPLILLLYDFLAETAVLGYLRQEFGIIEIDTVMLRKLLSDLSSAGPVLSSDRDDCLHNAPPSANPICCIYYTFNILIMQIL